jgi:hypothetical protein
MNRKAFTLVSTLVTLALIGILAVVFLKGGFTHASARKDQKDKTLVGAVMLSAKDTKCREYLQECRQAAMTQTSFNEDDQVPGSINDLKLGSELTHCAVGKEEYIYDPHKYAETKDLKDLVRCPHPGHEKY